MASLEDIQNYLNIDITNRRLRDGKKQPLKNRYYYYRYKYYIVELSQNMWTILEDCTITRRLLENYVWCVLNNYTATNIDKTTKYFHQLSQNYNIGSCNTLLFQTSCIYNYR